MVTATLLAGAALVLAAIVAVILWAKDKGDRGALAALKKWDPTWPPITITLHEDLAGAQWKNFVVALHAAVLFWNGETELPLFAPLEDLGTGRGVVPVIPKAAIVGDTKGEGLASTKLTFNAEGVIESAVIYVDRRKISKLTPDQLERVAAHELGHVLGLDHDESSWSVMHPRATSAPLELSKKDRRLLRAAYGAVLAPLLAVSCATGPKVQDSRAARCEAACLAGRSSCYEDHGGAYWDYCEADLEDCLELCY